MEVIPLFEDRFVVMAGTGHKRTGRRKLTLANLIDERCRCYISANIWP